MTDNERLLANCNIYISDLSSLQAENAALKEALREAREILDRPPSLLDPDFSREIQKLGETIGYGALMHGASALWRYSLGELAGGEFVVGHCQMIISQTLSRIDELLKGEG